MMKKERNGSIWKKMAAFGKSMTKKTAGMMKYVMIMAKWARQSVFFQIYSEFRSAMHLISSCYIMEFDNLFLPMS